ncbi:hypothetical protein, partial [Pseudomonas syringae group genomosp. 7]|uniref:hypothetical protein n=1 Tax=Pseudomonas syringae group genomosp. 7 TaxID=251699 RepID=UPI00376F7B40
DGQQWFSLAGGQAALCLGLSLNPERNLLESLGSLTFPEITLPYKLFLTLILLFRHNSHRL